MKDKYFDKRFRKDTMYITVRNGHSKWLCSYTRPFNKMYNCPSVATNAHGLGIDSIQKITSGQKSV